MGAACFPCYGRLFSPSKGAALCLTCPRASRGDTGVRALIAKGQPHHAVVCSLKHQHCTLTRRRHRSAMPRSVAKFGKPFLYMCPRHRRNIILPGNMLQCVSCSTGMYQPHEKTFSLSCNNCTAGHESIDGVACIACNPGMFNKLPGSYCKDCPAGFTEVDPGTHKCNVCDLGRASNKIRNDAIHCERCKPGTFSEALGQRKCKDCPAGYTQFIEGSLECTPCTPGRFSKTVRATKHPCDHCNPGFYANEIGQSSCIFCQPGKFQELTAAVNCTLARAGYTPTEDRSDVNKCSAGKFADVPGLPSCKECQPGQTQHLQGAHGCTPCAKGHATAISGSASVHCTACRRGRFSDTMGLSICKTCSPGAFQELRGAHNCSLTHAGYFPASDRQSQLPCEKCVCRARS